MTQRIEFFFSMTPKHSTFCFQNDWNNWTFFNMTLRTELFFDITQRNIIFFEYDSKNWTFLWMWFNDFFQKKNRSIEPFILLLQELNLFENMSHRIEPFFLILLKELNLFSKYDSKNWTFFSVELFFQYDSKNWTLFFRIWPKELNLFWMTQRIELLFLTQGIERFSIWPKEWNFFEKKRKNWTFFSLTQKIEFFQYDTPNWTFLNENTTHRIELFFLITTHRNGLISWIWRKDLNPFVLIWLKELTSFSHMTQRIELFILKRTMTQRIEPIFNTTRSIDFSNKIMTQRIQPFGLKINITLGIDLFFLVYDSKIFQNMTLRTELFFFKCDSKNWTFFWTLLEELYRICYVFKNWSLFSNKTPRIELFLRDSKVLFFKYDSKNWFFWLWL